MVELKIEENIYQMPNSWKEVNIKKYIEINNLETKSNVKKMVQMISILSGCPINILYQVDLEALNKIDINWLSEPMDDKIEKILEIDGKKYGIIKEMKKLSLGEYVDLDSYILDINNNLHMIVAILMRPILSEDGDLYIIEKYDTNTLKARAELFLENMNVEQLINVSSFFSNSANGYLESMKSFLQSQEKTIKI